MGEKPWQKDPVDMEIMDDVACELWEAREAHGDMKNAHEAYAVIREELDEFWEEVKKKKQSNRAMMKELIQVAAMAVRAIADLGMPSLSIHEPD